jgi:general control protein GCN4
MAGKALATRAPAPVLTFADLRSNNSFDGGAHLFPALQSNGYHNMEQVSAFTAINDRSAGQSVRTVSPKDIFNDGFGSAPPSTAFTNLTSPDIGDSPYLNDSFECSPMFGDDPLNLSHHTDDWFPLFPEEPSRLTEPRYMPAVSSLPLERTISSQSMERSGSSSTDSPLVLDGSFRRKSSTTNSPSSLNGIGKARRRKGPLPAISVDPSDKTALKRARNTLAARESRQRKFDHVSELETQVAELQADVEKWKNIAIGLGHNP